MKVTKKQRKQAAGANAAVKRSLQQGQSMAIADVEYTGKPPVFAPTFDATGAVTGYRTVSHGVPFVKTARWTDNHSSYRPV